MRTAVSGMVRMPATHSIAIAALALALLAYGSARLVGWRLEALEEALGSGVELTVYLEDVQRPSAALADEVARVVQRPVRTVSPTDALARLGNELGEEASALRSLSPNPLPWTIEVSVPSASADRDAMAALAARLRALPGVAGVEYGEDAVARLALLRIALRQAALVLFALVFATAAVVVSATLQLAIFSRREEIEIQKLVGATDAFVRFPYLLEGLLQGALAAPLALALCYAGTRLLSIHASVDFRVQWTSLLLELTAIGLALGFAGSLLAVRRFLRA